MGTVTKVASRILIGALALCTFAAWADPPGRAIRIAGVSGPVSFLPSGESDWVQARINRPLWTGDRLWIDRGARTELQLGGAALFVAPESSLAVLNFDDDRAQFEVTQGIVEVYVRNLGRNDSIEIDTPNLAFVVRSPGEYRIDVRPDGESTAVAVLRGEGEAFGQRAAYTLRAGQGFRFFGTDLADYDAEPVRRASSWDSWVATRVRSYERSASARYVSPEMVGFADLDAYGTWRTVASYGPVWVPSRVDADWAPYRNGHWSWVDPWGWTWVDDAPWGFAPFHYGRWAYVDNRYWGWVPGPRNAAPVYAPALVAFVASSGSSVGWFPLAPGEVYRPAYDASREYFTRVNVTNTVVNVTQVTNVYNNPRTTEVRYVNVNNVNAVTAIPTQAFAQSQSVQRAAVRMDRNALRSTQVVAAAPVAPARGSLTGAAPAVARPDQRIVDRRVVAKEAPPPAPASMERRQEAMRQQPGKPLDRSEISKGAPPRQNVTVVQAGPAPQPIGAAPPGERGKGRERQASEPGKGGPPQTAQPAPPPRSTQPTAPPPQVAQPAPSERGKGNAERGRPDERPQPAARASEPPRPNVAAPPPTQQQPPPPQVAQPAPSERGKGNAERGRPDERPQPAARAPEPPRPSVAAPPPAQQQPPPPQVAQPAPSERGKGNADRGRPDERGQPAAKAPEPPRPSVAAPPSAQPQPAPPAQAAQPPQPHDNKESHGKRDDDGPPGKGRNKD